MDDAPVQAPAPGTPAVHTTPPETPRGTKRGAEGEPPDECRTNPPSPLPSWSHRGPPGASVSAVAADHLDEDPAAYLAGGAGEDDFLTDFGADGGGTGDASETYGDLLAEGVEKELAQLLGFGVYEDVPGEVARARIAAGATFVTTRWETQWKYDNVLGR